MNVRELIEALKSVDADLPVYVRGYEDGVDDVTSVNPVMVARDVWPDTWYYGDHSTSDYDAGDKPRTPGVEIV